MRKIAKFVFVLAFLCSSVVFAQNTGAQSDEEFMNNLRESFQDPAAAMAQDTQFGGRSEENMGIVVLRIVGSLALVLGILAAVAWGVRKSGLFASSVPAATQTPSMSVLEILTTGLGGVILLVRCEKRVLLIGQTASSYTLLREFDENESLKIIENKVGSESITSFKSSLSNFLQNVKVQQVSAAKTPNVSRPRI